jgi:hypothetical protein
MIPEAPQTRTAFCKAFTFLVAWLVVTGWGLSCLNALRWIEVVSLPGLATAVWLARRWGGSEASFWRSLREPLSYWPFLLVAGLGLLGQWLYPPTMLDSLTYRLPRLFLWLQNGNLQHVMTAEPRLDYMPQTWGLATLPLVQLAGDQLVWVWTFASWIVLYLLAYDWALELNGDIKKSRLMAFLASTSTFAVLQAASSANDLFAGVLALLALRFVMNFERTRAGWEINWAVLAFCIAAGTKPHFAVFGLPLTVWFFLSPSRPWKAFRWAWLPAVLAVWLLCSPVPSFYLNFQSYGNWSGAGQDVSIKGKSPVWNLVLGGAMIGWQSLQPPVDPASSWLNRQLDRLVPETYLVKKVPRFNLRAYPVSLVDGAALGLVTSTLFVLGVVMAWRGNPAAWRSWQSLALAAGLLGILLALSIFVSGSSGRAFAGFLYLGLPLALVGWNRMQAKMLNWSLYLSLGSSLLVLVLFPSHPLWPVRWVQQQLAGTPRFQRLAQQMEPYIEYSERADTGEALMQAIPRNACRVAILVGDDRPLLPLFRPYSLHRELLFLPPHAAPRDLNGLAADYVVTGGGAEVEYPELLEYLKATNDWQLIMEKDYISKLARGPESWRLYRLNQGARRIAKGRFTPPQAGVH